ncbi:MAG: GNAT family N-acetyltransferase [Burkholderiaceae bacterium]
MTIDDDAGTRDLLALWIRGWASARGVPAPVPEGEGWRVEVGLAQQVRRHVFAGITPTLRALGETVREPWCFLKACATVEAMRAALPARWTVQPQTFLMRHDAAPPAARPLPPGYHLAVAPDPALPHVAMASVSAPDGTHAADGRLVIVGDHAIYDRIGTGEAHRRRGLGAAVMAALHERAHALGARRGLLAATEAGHALYLTLGWRVQAPYASAVIEGDAADG